MKKYQKNALWLVAIAFILAGGSYGAWYAWDNGKIGDNPRAPTPQAMEKAVRFQAAYQIMTGGARQQPCLGLDSGSDTNDVNGITGISPSGFPGQHAITLLLQTNVRNQQVRDARIAQLDYFARQGLFTASDTTITTDDGVSRPARTYRITWKGYTHAQTNYGSQLCFDYGRREYASIESIEKTLEKIMDLDVYEVSYKTAVRDIPAWAITDEAKKLFPKLSDFIREGSGKAKILRAKEGWQAAYEVEAEIGMAAKGAEGAQYLSQHLKRLKAQLDGSPSITLEEAKSLVAKHLADPDRAGRIGVPCLSLNLQRGGDDKPDPAAARDATDFVVTYFDKGDRKPYEYQQMARNLNILAALEHAGLAEMEIIRPAPPPLVVKPQASRRAAPTPPEPLKPSGIRYKVGREAASALGITGYGGGCVPAGRIKAEVLAVKPLSNGYGEAQAQIYVRASVEQSPEWALKIAEQLPALKAILDEGLPMGGQILKTPSGPDEGKWQLNGLTPHYPQMAFQTIPPHLKPIMPQTLAAMPVKAVKAPGLVFEPRTMPAPAMRAPGLVPMPSGPMPAPAAPAAPPAPSADFSPAPAMVKVATPAPEPKKPASGPIFPADGSPVHVISIYQAPLPGGREREPYEQAAGIANVSISENHATLLLLGHDSVEWRINVPSGVKLKRVVAAGYHDQRVVLSGGGKPQVSATRHELIDRQTDGALSKASGSYSVPYKSDPNSLLRMAEIAQFLTGSQPASFQGTYEAPKTGFAIEAKTPKFALAAPRAPGAVATTIILRAMFKEMINGYAVSRGRAGAFNAAWSEQTFSAGKGYFEGKARVVGSFSMHGYANIGMCPAGEHEVNTHFDKTVLAVESGEQSLYKDGDLFGVAADFDNQIAYFRVNGKWLNGAPGSGSGKRLQKGVEYRACVITSGSTMGGSNDGKQSNTGWEVNFGDKPFAHPLPPGYRPLQGGPTQT